MTNTVINAMERDEKPAKKPLYTGDPNATMTMCVKKLRRHLARDLQLVGVSKPLQKDEKREILPFFVCRHCKKNPFNL